MYIVLEGLDKCGKTSLANFLSKKLNLPIKKFSQPKGDPYVEYMEFLTTDFKPKILDRFYLGELAYGPVKRGKSGITNDERRNIELSLMAANPLLIYCETDNRTITDNFIKDGETFTKVSEIKALKQAFHGAINTGLLKWHIFNYKNDGNYKKIMNKVNEWTQDLDEFSTYFMRRQMVIGNLNSTTLLVGDVCNVKLKENKGIPVPFGAGKSADYLFTALKLAKIDLGNIAITNFEKYHNGNIGITVEEAFMPNLKRIIYLGSKYYNQRSDLFINRVINHPSWAARFNYPIKTYAKELREVILK
jgi:hypothetical protein